MKLARLQVRTSGGPFKIRALRARLHREILYVQFLEIVVGNRMCLVKMVFGEEGHTAEHPLFSGKQMTNKSHKKNNFKATVVTINNELQEKKCVIHPKLLYMLL